MGLYIDVLLNANRSIPLAVEYRQYTVWWEGKGDLPDLRSLRTVSARIVSGSR